MAIRTLYGFDEDGNKIAVGSYVLPEVSINVTKIDEYGNSLATSSIPITGAGLYSIGDTCTLTAPSTYSNGNFDFDFIKWLEGWDEGSPIEVSSNTSYTFTVTGAKTLTAMFHVW